MDKDYAGCTQPVLESVGPRVSHYWLIINTENSKFFDKSLYKSRTVLIEVTNRLNWIIWSTIMKKC